MGLKCVILFAYLVGWWMDAGQIFLILYFRWMDGCWLVAYTYLYHLAGNDDYVDDVADDVTDDDAKLK